MAAPRKKSLPQAAPTNIAEATQRLADYHQLVSAIETMKLDARTAMGQIEAARDAGLAPLEEAAKAIFLEMRSWWAVAGGMMTEGRRKSIELAGCIIGERTTTPSLKLPRGLTSDQLIDRLIAISPETYSIKYSINKPSCIAMIRDPLSDIGRRLESEALLAVTQREEFFIDFTGDKPPSSEGIATPAVAITSAPNRT